MSCRSSPPLHPMIVHLPLALALVVPLLALVVALGWWRHWWPARSWTLVVLLQALLVAGAWAALETGEDDEERVEAVVSEQALEVHEERAEVFLSGAVAVLVATLLPLVIPAPAWKRSSVALALIGTLVVAALAVRVGEAGGELVYRHGAASVHVGSGATGEGTVGVAERDED